MKCEFCGETLPIVGGFNGISGVELESYIDNIQNEFPDGHLYLDIDGGIVTQFFCPKNFSKLDGYRCLCKQCAGKLDVYADKLLEAQRNLETRLAQNIARNAVNARRYKPVPPYLVAFDLDIPAHPVAQVFKKIDGDYRLCNQLNDEAVGTLLRYMEGSTHVFGD